MIEEASGTFMKQGQGVEGLEVSGAIEHSSDSLDPQGRSYATGKRKSSIARVWLQRGKGVYRVNDKKMTDYFPSYSLHRIFLSPFVVGNCENQFDVCCTARGGGISGQVQAIRLGISKALLNFDFSLKPLLREEKMLTRDSRKVERKKYGRKKARKSFQFSKR